MASVSKYNKFQIGGLTRHFERHKKESGEYIQFSNQNIDLNKINLNYNLAPECDEGQLSFIDKRISEVKCQNRADVNVMCSWVVTAPVGLATDVEYMADGKPRLSFKGNEKELELFFRESYKFLNQRYANGSEKNVVSSYVHMDEVTPHMHYAFIPVVYDKKKDVEKVSAKVLLNRSDLQKFHQDLEQHMEKVFGCELGLLNHATRDGNKDVQTLKRERAIAEYQKALADEIKPIEGKIAGEQTINKFIGQNVYEQRQHGVLGEKGVFIAGVTKADVLKIAKASRQRLNDVRKANEKAMIAEKEKANTVLQAGKEIEKQKEITKKAVEAWDKTVEVYKGTTFNGQSVETPDDIIKAARHFKNRTFELKKVADKVPNLEMRVEFLEQNQSTPKQREFSKLPYNLQDALLEQGRSWLEELKQKEFEDKERKRIQNRNRGMER